MVWLLLSLINICSIVHSSIWLGCVVACCLLPSEVIIGICLWTYSSQLKLLRDKLCRLVSHPQEFKVREQVGVSIMLVGRFSTLSPLTMGLPRGYIGIISRNIVDIKFVRITLLVNSTHTYEHIPIRL